MRHPQPSPVAVSSTVYTCAQRVILTSTNVLYTKAFALAALAARSSSDIMRKVDRIDYEEMVNVESISSLLSLLMCV